jgi:serine/threonine protein kinase/Tol biopolymer transport system component
MNAERWRRIEELYHASLEVAKDRRADFLCQACGADDELRHEVESLLVHEKTSQKFIEEPAFEVAARLIAHDKSVAVEADPVAIGTVVSHFRVEEKLGRGGMGVVYRAEDTALGRAVALKFLTTDAARDQQSLERLRREARAASALNHPNICTIYEIGTHGEQSFIAMELVEGETLEHRLKKGPLPTEQVLRYAVQIAQALAKVHRMGFTHRDLKPANVMLTKTGLKLMDFGVAKRSATTILISDPAKTSQERAKLTGEGTLVGTFQYMAPEQLEGKEADARSDIFAFGEVIYEMATGVVAFSSTSGASLIAAIFSSEPKPMAASQPMTPPGLERVVRKCLAKDPEERWQSASDLATELQWIASGETRVGESGRGSRKSRFLFLYAAAAVVFLAVVGLAGVSYWRTSPEPAQAITAQIQPPRNASFRFSGGMDDQSLAVAPDGHALAFSAQDENGKTMVWIRPIESAEAHPLPGTEGASDVFWSPDSRNLGFFAGGNLEKVDVAGGQREVIAAVPFDIGGSWGRDDTIVFSDNQKGLYKVPASGGVATPVVEPDGSNVTLCARPQFFPDGKQILYFSSGPRADMIGTWLTSLDGKQRKLLVRGAQAKYSSGFLLYVLGSQLMAQPFDPVKGELRGEPVPLIEQILVGPGGALFSVSEKYLLYQSAGRADQKLLAWFDRSGHSLGAVGEPGDYFDVRLSPDGGKLAANAGSPYSDIWVHDLAHPILTRLTIDPNSDHGLPVWSPDGTRVAYAVLTGKSQFGIYDKRSNGAGNEELLLAAKDADAGLLPTSWSRDGKLLLFTRGRIPQHSGLWVLPLAGDRRPLSLANAPAAAEEGVFSPDDKWIAYVSRESGTDEVYVMPFDEDILLHPNASQKPGGDKWQISTRGGRSPRWRADGKELFWRSPTGQMMSAKLGIRDHGIEAQNPEILFRTQMDSIIFEPYDVTPDGKKFVINTGSEAEDSLMLTANWTALVKSR